MRPYHDPDEGQSIQLKKGDVRAKYIIFVFIYFVIYHTLYYEEDLFFLVDAFIVGSNLTQLKFSFKHLFSKYDYLQCIMSGVLSYTVH